MKSGAHIVGARVMLIAFLIARASHAFAESPDQLKDIGMVERATSRLAQIDVTVSGERPFIEGLTASDFEVRLNDKIVPNLLLDDFCPTALRIEAPTAASSQVASPTQVKATRAAKTSFLFYFDMAHLTQAGRQNAIDSARAMLPKLLAGGDAAMVVANAAELKTIVPLTTDGAQLSAAVTSLRADQSTFDVYATMEQRRMADIIGELGSAPTINRHETGMDPNMGGLGAALRLARLYAAEERWRQERDLRRLSMVLGRFADLDPPKVVLYFADTMRQNAGEHYLSFFGGTNLRDANGKPLADAEAVLVDAATGVLPLDRVINDAAAIGIRFYTIEGEGITDAMSPIESRSSASNNRPGAAGNQATPVVNSQHVTDSQNTLVSLAAETGGRAFLNGVAPNRMAAQIVGDLSCVYLLSFDPRGFAVDSPLAVAVTVRKPKVTTSVRGRLVIQSDSARLTGRVLSAFAMPAAGVQASDSGIRVGLVPMSYKSGKYTARVQIALAGSAVPATSWDIGASLVSRGAVRQDGSGHIQVTQPNTPVIYETDMEFAPGDYDLVAVAHEAQTDTVLSNESHGTWPKIDTELASLLPVAVSQPRAGGFLRNGLKQTQGAVLIAEDEPLRAGAPTAMIAFVCRAKDQKRPVQVVRTLVGEQETPVGKTDLEVTSERCAQVVDLIPAKTLGAGRYRFVVTVSSEGKELTRVERALIVPDSAPAPTVPPADGPTSKPYATLRSRARNLSTGFISICTGS